MTPLSFKCKQPLKSLGVRYIKCCGRLCVVLVCSGFVTGVGHSRVLTFVRVSCYAPLISCVLCCLLCRNTDGWGGVGDMLLQLLCLLVIWMQKAHLTSQSVAEHIRALLCLVGARWCDYSCL